jgi:hypothetical protein
MRPSEVMKKLYTDKGMTFYRLYLATPEDSAEIMKDLRRYLLGFYAPAEK